ncbi:enoyl-CoA hydratase-related protein [Arthrobacter sp. GCM10027362]|uniref:enoyl-CoA hydratase-related protein n=1 Tax=Arthrobacter sp. GCM10027362 TaxID=3273379 RepID=UPI0036316DD3
MTEVAEKAHVTNRSREYSLVRVERRGPVALITIDRPEALNALYEELIGELEGAFDEVDRDDEVRAVVLTGSRKAFAAGADVELQPRGFTKVFLEDFRGNCIRAASMRKPMIAAVAGYALGAGAEPAMMCDFIVAADTAKFGQPEITLGALPGAGGTQRLARFVGKSKAMEMVLTGRIIEAEEAERIGLVARIVPAEDLVEEAAAAARKIARFSHPAVLMAKEAVNCAFETPLAEGLRLERRLFQAAWAMDGRKEGIPAYLEKRQPHFSHR